MARRSFLTSAGLLCTSEIGSPASRPNIDRLANQGVRLTNGYVSAAVYSPSRAGFMTGRYQARFGHDFNPAGRRASPEAALPKQELTIAERLRGSD